MGSISITGSPESIDLTTPARIAIQRDLGGSADPRTELIAATISEVSAEITDYLAMHTLRTERTEDYELPQFERGITLAGIDVDVSADAITVLAASEYRDLPTAAPLVSGADYVVRPRNGTLRIVGKQEWDPAYIRVTYTGGLFADASEIGTKHGWITAAAEKQIVYRLQRMLTLGGNISSSPGGGTNFVDEYGLLKTVKAMLVAHRRIYI